jgi:hypothetical protein
MLEENVISLPNYLFPNLFRGWILITFSALCTVIFRVMSPCSLVTSALHPPSEQKWRRWHVPRNVGNQPGRLRRHILGDHNPHFYRRGNFKCQPISHFMSDIHSWDSRIWGSHGGEYEDGCFLGWVVSETLVNFYQTTRRYATGPKVRGLKPGRGR